jgi:hypothetical protein
MCEPVSVAELSFAIASLQAMQNVGADIDVRQLDCLNRANRTFLAERITAIIQNPKANVPEDWRTGGANGLLLSRLFESGAGTHDSSTSEFGHSQLIASTSVFKRLTDLILAQRMLKLIGLPAATP